MKTNEQEAARAIELELHRLRDSCERQLTLEVWGDGRCKISCSTGMRIARCSKLLEILGKIPSDAPWVRVWEALFDFPEAPV